MKETICHIFDQPVPPLANAGGANRLIHWLANAQARAGHRVYVAAPGGKDTRWYDFIRLPKDFTFSQFQKVMPKGTTAIEYHGGGDRGVSRQLERIKIPVLRIMHGVASERTEKNTVFVSESHARNHGGSVHAYNGIPVNEFTFQRQKSDFLLFLAKVKRSKKGVADAISIAKKTGNKLLIAGGRRLGSPHTWFGWHPRIRPVGFVNGECKKKIIAGARALLAPIKWEEPFGLTFVEAMASGTPVLAYNRGAAREVVEHGVTGFICNNRSDMADAIKRLDEIDPYQCRLRVEKLFSDVCMAKRHLCLIQKVRSGQCWQ